MILHWMGVLLAFCCSWAAASDTPTAEQHMTISCDNAYEVYVNGGLVGTGNNWRQATTFALSLRPGHHVIAIKGSDTGGVAGLLAVQSQNSGVVQSQNSGVVPATAP
jgi:hypothetical protein